EPEREQEEAPVPEGAEQFVSRVKGDAHPSAPVVSSTKASSRPAPVISISLAAGYLASSPRMAVSESEQLRTTDSPWRSARVTPGSDSRSASSASGRVARIRRLPTIALIS